MTLDEARAHIGSGVVYTPPSGGKREDGVITSVNNLVVFVRYGSDAGAKATFPENLELLAGGVS